MESLAVLAFPPLIVQGVVPAQESTYSSVRVATTLLHPCSAVRDKKYQSFLYYRFYNRKNQVKHK